MLLPLRSLRLCVKFLAFYEIIIINFTKSRVQ